jgi:hypothetical protein
MIRFRDHGLSCSWWLLLMNSFSTIVVLLLGTNQSSSSAFLLRDREGPGQIRILNKHSCPSSSSSSGTIVLNVHRFNGGYDPSSPLTWTPQQAAEFAIFHEGTPHHAGMQLRTAIQHWRGDDLAEFLTRLYLGKERQQQVQPSLQSNHNHNDDDYHNNNHQRSLVYEPQHVRAPQWWGLETREGLVALKSLLSEALSNDTLQPREVARFAESFLLKEYKWPSDQPWDDATGTTTNAPPQVVFEQDSFYSRGHGVALAHVLWSVRRQRYGDPAFTPDDIVDMVTLPEREDKESTSLQMKEFFQTLARKIVLAEADKTRIVQRLAIGGWGPASIPQFVTTILDRNPRTVSQGHYSGESSEFSDYPSQLDDESQINNNKNNNDITMNEWNEIEQQQFNDHNVGDYTATAVDDQVVLGYSKNRNEQARDSVRKEYDQLVQEYWKRVEVPKRLSVEEEFNEVYATTRTSE